MSQHGRIRKRHGQLAHLLLGNAHGKVGTVGQKRGVGAPTARKSRGREREGKVAGRRGSVGDGRHTLGSGSNGSPRVSDERVAAASSHDLVHHAVAVDKAVVHESSLLLLLLLSIQHVGHLAHVRGSHHQTVASTTSCIQQLILLLLLLLLKEVLLQQGLIHLLLAETSSSCTSSHGRVHRARNSRSGSDVPSGKSQVIGLQESILSISCGIATVHTVVVAAAVEVKERRRVHYWNA
mmetsp:Transcript_8034/g.16920  ORF Transcript_8034/g.16920 Transcript_8034/m.16920 type:complete len:237 (-) Transcript_8034:166-876(-)